MMVFNTWSNHLQVQILNEWNKAIHIASSRCGEEWTKPQATWRMWAKQWVKLKPKRKSRAESLSIHFPQLQTTELLYLPSKWFKQLIKQPILFSYINRVSVCINEPRFIAGGTAYCRRRTNWYKGSEVIKSNLYAPLTIKTPLIGKNM